MSGSTFNESSESKNRPYQKITSFYAESSIHSERSLPANCVPEDLTHFEIRTNPIIALRDGHTDILIYAYRKTGTQSWSYQQVEILEMSVNP